MQEGKSQQVEHKERSHKCKKMRVLWFRVQKEVKTESSSREMNARTDQTGETSKRKETFHR